MSITNVCIFLAYTVLYDIIHQKQEKSKNIYDFGEKKALNLDSFGWN